jgi:hypothetical protein
VVRAELSEVRSRRASLLPQGATPDRGCVERRAPDTQPRSPRAPQSSHAWPCSTYMPLWKNLDSCRGRAGNDSPSGRAPVRQTRATSSNGEEPNQRRERCTCARPNAAWIRREPSRHDPSSRLSVIGGELVYRSGERSRLSVAMGGRHPRARTVVLPLPTAARSRSRRRLPMTETTPLASRECQRIGP